MELSPAGNTIFTLLFLAAVMHGFFLAALLFVKSMNEPGLKWLGMMMVPLSLLLLTYLLYLGDSMRNTPHLLGIFAPIPYLIGPLFYFFVIRSVDDREFKWFDSLHLIPFLYVLWEYIPVFQLPVEVKMDLINQVYNHQRPPFIELVKANRLNYLILGYALAAIIYLKTKLKEDPSRMPRIQWLSIFSKVFGAVLLGRILIMVFIWWLGAPGASVEMILTLILAGAIHMIGYVVLGKDRVLPAIIQNGKYATSPLSNVMMVEYARLIKDHLKNKKPWMDPGFTITDLSHQVHIPKHHLSQVLNEELGKRFNDVICEYRVAEVRRRLIQGATERYSILGIANDCGFKSKSSFHRAFKKVTGQTPGSYISTQLSTPAN